LKGEKGMKKRSNTKRYSIEFRINAVKLKIEKGYSLKATANEIGLTDTKQLRSWIKLYKAEGIEGLKDKKPKMREVTKAARKGKSELEYLRAENAVLHYLLEAKKKDDMKLLKH
jgi:transposase